MTPGMPKGKPPKIFHGVHARLVSLKKKEDEQAVLDLMRRFSGATRFAYPPWRVLRVGAFLSLLGLEVPRDLSPLEPILHFTEQGIVGGGGSAPKGLPCS